MNETEFAFRIRQALNEGADKVSYKAGLRLERARQLAVGRARGAAVARPATVRLPALQLATASGPALDGPGSGGLWGWLRGAGLATPLLALAIGFVAIYQWHHNRLISELANVDFAVLLDEAPIAAYADRDFGALLSRPDLLTLPEEGAADTDTDAPASEPDEPAATPAADASLPDAARTVQL